MTVNSIVETAKIVSLLMVFTYLIINHKSFKKAIIGLGSRKDHTILGIFYGMLSIIGISSGRLVFNNLYIQSNLVGPLVGGIMFGPITGGIAGIVGGIFRLTIFNNNSLSDFIMTVFAGLIGSLYYKLNKNKKKKFLTIYLYGLFVELLSLISVTMTISPRILYEVYFSMIGIYMIFINPIGVVMLVSLSTDIQYNQNLVGANYAEKALRIARKTFEILENGLNYKNVQKLADVIYKYVPLAGLEIKIMNFKPAYCGDKGLLLGEYESNYNLRESKIYESKDKELVNLYQPLFIGTDEIGRIVFAKHANQIEPADKKLIEGIGNLLSPQIQNTIAKEQKKQLIKSEYKALRAQVNPHFLYNALNAIKTMIRTDSEKAQDLIVDLALFYRKSLSKNEEYISVLEEFKIIMVYTNIQKARFGKRLKIITNLSEDIFYEEMPSFILQPIVENATIHGTSKIDLNRVNEIEIKGEKKDGYLLFTIKDTGDGFPEDILNNFYKDKPLESSSIGLYNIKKRLSSIFDQDFEISLKNIDSGAYVFLKIPVKNGGK